MTQPLIPKKLTAQWACFWLAFPISMLLTSVLLVVIGRSSVYALEPTGVLIGLGINLVFCMLVLALCRKVLWLFPIVCGLFAAGLALGFRALALRGSTFDWVIESTAAAASGVQALVGGAITLLLWRYVVPHLP